MLNMITFLQRNAVTTSKPMTSNSFPFFAVLGSASGKLARFNHSQLEVQAIIERGWLLTKAAELATSKPKTMVTAKNCIIA
jgi:hypothetical protein